MKSEVNQDLPTTTSNFTVSMSSILEQIEVIKKLYVLIYRVSPTCMNSTSPNFSAMYRHKIHTSLLVNSYYLDLVYDRNPYFGLGLILIPKPILADTFGLIL